MNAWIVQGGGEFGGDGGPELVLCIASLHTDNRCFWVNVLPQCCGRKVIHGDPHGRSTSS